MRSMIALFVLVSSQSAYADCICLNRGVEVSEGQTACIQTNSGNRLAVCEKNLNVTNWKFLEEGCPLAEGQTKRKLVRQSTPFKPHFQKRLG